MTGSAEKNNFHLRGEKKVCVIDDDEMQSLMLEDYLAKNPLYFIDTFSTGEEFLKAFIAGEIPDVIILDWNLDSEKPHAMSGLEVLKSMKAHNSSLRVIMYSAETEYSKALKAIAHGAEEFVIKDHDTFEKIERLLENKKP